MNVYDAIPLFVDGETEKFDCAGTRIQGVIAVRDSGSVGKDPGIFQIVGNFADKWITKDRIKTIRSISLSNYLGYSEIVDFMRRCIAYPAIPLSSHLSLL